jgi:hypothetical protein
MLPGEDERPETARVVWDDEAGEVEVVLDGRAGREGLAVLQEVYVRYDAETGVLLSVILVPQVRPVPPPE